MARTTGEAFPLQWERVVWSARPAFPRALTGFRTQYVLTDFRILIRRSDRTVHEIAVDDVAHVELRQGRLQRLWGTSTVVIYCRHSGHGRRHTHHRRKPVELVDVRQGPQLALVLQLLTTEGASVTADDEFVRSALGPNSPRLLRPKHAVFAGATLAFSIALAVATLARHDTLAPVAYAPDDPIAPNGQRRSRAEITAFMIREVMPFARRTFGPLKGGADNISCYTCHGLDADERDWSMPAVRALPEPELRLAGLEQARLPIDPQMRNAIYGYLAHKGKQHIAGYMRGVVVPGMAALLQRPAYDFTKSYSYNRARAALGCYHCHLVEKS